MPTVIFDFDGVLADTLQDLLEFSQIVCARLGHPCRPGPADLDALERMSFNDLGRQLGVPDDLVDDYVQGCFDLFVQRPTPPAIFPGMQAAILSCAANCRMGVVTGNVTAAVQDFLVFHGISACVSHILGADLAGSRAEKIRQMHQHLGGANPKCTLMVGDSVSDIHAAREAGVGCIAVAWGHQSPQKLIQLQPDYFVNTPKELGKLLTQLSKKGN